MKSKQETYAGGEILEDKGPPLSKVLLIIYFCALVWGAWALIAYWDGSSGSLDRGGWQALQTQAQTRPVSH